jgi:hypothetical protein
MTVDDRCQNGSVLSDIGRHLHLHRSLIDWVVESLEVKLKQQQSSGTVLVTALS